MKSNYPIPAIMKDLPLDERGYPTPFFVPIVNGKPDFRYQDARKRQLCLDHSWCAVCGKKLYPKAYWFVCGPLGLANKVHSDAPCHEDCARFSLNVCPHLFLHKAKRRSDEELHTNPNLLRSKPDTLFLVKADKYGAYISGGHQYIQFRPVYHEQYIYQNNELIRKPQ